MKKITLTTVLSLSVFGLFAQETLQNFNPDEITPVIESYPNNYGYYTGHNNYGDEEFAEKYQIDGTGTIHGIIAIHDGQEGTGSLSASYRIYSVANNGLPNTPIANKNIPYSDIPVDGSLFTVNFNNPIEVSDEFFTSFRLGDYSHGGLGTKRIAITHAPDGTRPESDFDVYGRNVVRFHSHGATVWADYRTENFTNYNPAVYFSLFPVIELSSASVIDFGKQANIGAVYPNPSDSGMFNVPLNTAGGNAEFKLYDLTGKLIIEKSIELISGDANYQFSTENVQAGTYLLMINMPEGKVAQRVILK